MPTRHNRQRPGRIRRLAAGLCAALLVVAGAAWVVSVRRGHVVDYRWGHARESTPTPAQPWAWSFEALSVGASNSWEGVGLSMSRYTSYAPTRAELEPWDKWTGWHVNTIARVGGRGVPPPPSTYWTAWDDFGVLGVGVRKSSRQGIDAHALRAPHWALVVALAAAGAGLAWPDVRRWRRRRRGWCVGCGYDRFGLAAGAACPECNAPGAAGGATQP